VTVSIGTFEDLQPDRGRPIDRNPSLPCDGPCSRSFNRQDYWQPRHVGIGGDPRDAAFICDDCLAMAIKFQKRRQNNQKLSEFLEADERGGEGA